MTENHLWLKAQNIPFQTGPEIVGGFDIGFDNKIPEQTKDQLMDFVYWVEDHFSLPITLWVDFKYKHYLVGENKKRVNYKFYWAEFENYPTFTNPDDIPVIELPVNRKIDDILPSFIEAITQYYTWLTKATPTGDETEEILQAYLKK